MPYSIGPQGNRICYRIVGDSGAHVVLVHGLALSGRFWFGVPQRLANAPMQPQRVLVPDNRGTGGSELPTRPWGMSAMADDIVAVLDAAQVDSAVVVGISLGGMVAQHVALRHPDRVDGLVLMATTAGIPQITLPRGTVFFNVFLRSLFFRRRQVELLGRLLLPAAEQHRAGELLAEWPRLMRAEAAGRWATACQLAAVVSHSTGFRLQQIRCPAVVMTGDQDILVPPANSRRLAERIPRATLDILSGTAHGIPLLDPDAVGRGVAHVRRAARDGGFGSAAVAGDDGAAA